MFVAAAAEFYTATTKGIKGKLYDEDRARKALSNLFEHLGEPEDE